MHRAIHWLCLAQECFVANSINSGKIHNVEEALFESEDLGYVVVVSPTRDMGEFEMADYDVSAYDQLVRLTDGRNVVLDFSQTDYFGSSTIGMFIRLAKHVHAQNRAIAFCNLSEH